MTNELIRVKRDLIVIKLTIAAIVALLVIGGITLFLLIEPFCCGDIVIP
jgi:hypothetical protein